MPLTKKATEKLALKFDTAGMDDSARKTALRV